MDEFHFYADPDRGWAWQVPLLELPEAQFVLMSATLGDVTRFEADLTRRTGRPTAVVSSVDAAGAAAFLLRARRRCTRRSRSCSPPTRRRSTSCTSPRPPAIERAQALMSINVCTRAEKDAIADADRRLPVHRRASARRSPGSCATASACTTPGCCRSTAGWSSARAGRAAEGDLRHRHARRRHQRPDPHRAAHRADQVRRHPAPASSRRASSTRSPAGPAAPASTPPAPSWCRRPST